MCRLLAVRGEDPFDIAPHLAAFREVARRSPEYQGHGWGCAWRDGNRWRLYRNLTPVWEDPDPPAARTTLFLAHARSAFRDEGIRIENNMPFSDGERVFLFNGELRGVRIRERGRIGAEKVFHFVKRFDRGDLREALAAGLPRIEQRTRYVRAMNVIAADAAGRVAVASRFSENPGYFQLRRAVLGREQVICSAPYPDDATPAQADLTWTPIPDGTITSF